MRALRAWITELWWSHGRTRCFSCRRWFPPHAFWNPWHGERLTAGIVHRLVAKGELTPAQAAAAVLAVERGHHGLCCSDDCCEAARTGSASTGIARVTSQH